jgi:hypothetical protein
MNSIIYPTKNKYVNKITNLKLESCQSLLLFCTSMIKYQQGLATIEVDFLTYYDVYNIPIDYSFVTRAYPNVLLPTNLYNNQYAQPDRILGYYDLL